MRLKLGPKTEIVIDTLEYRDRNIELKAFPLIVTYKSCLCQLYNKHTLIVTSYQKISARSKYKRVSCSMQQFDLVLMDAMWEERALFNDMWTYSFIGSASEVKIHD